MLTSEQFSELRGLANTIEEALERVSTLIRSADRSLYERWHAYGKQVSSEFVSMGPCLQDVVEELESVVCDDDDED